MWKGRPTDSRLWLSEVRARWYDPVLGRFMSEDPIGLAGGINPYLFANDDPVNGRDPSGMFVDMPGDDGDDINQALHVGGSGDPCVSKSLVSYNIETGAINGVLATWDECHYAPVSLTPAGKSKGGGAGKATATKKKLCTESQQEAAQLAQSFESASNSAGVIAFGAGITVALSAAGEGVTFGVDTPLTIASGSVAGFFATTSTATGAAGAALNSFANGNLSSLRNFGWGQIANLASTAATIRIPVLARWSDTIGNLAERAAELTHAAQEACR